MQNDKSSKTTPETYESSKKETSSNDSPMKSLPAIEGVNLLEIKQDKIFSIYSKDGKISNIKIISSTPIFELGNKVFYNIPLGTVEVTDLNNGTQRTDSLKPVIGLYGTESGYGINPLDFYTKSGGAKHNATIIESNMLVNKNQLRTIELGILEALKMGNIIKKSPNLLLNKLEKCSINGTVDEIRDKIKYYIKLDNELQYIIATCFILGTYLFPLFSTFGYLIISGEKGAGKGTFLDIMEKTCWNATSKQISVSEAVLFRRIAEQRPTLIIDEYHRAIKHRNSGNALISILESGYEKGGCVPRVEEVRDGKIRKYVVVDYPVYGPKIVATRMPVEADDKGIKIIMPKISTDQIFAKRKKELEYDPFFENIRLNTMKWCINHQDSVLKEYMAIEPNHQLNGREFNVWLPVLAIAKVAFPEKYKNLLKFAGDTVCSARSATYEKEDRVLTALYYLSRAGELKDGENRLNTPSYKVTNKEISTTLQENEDEGMHHNTIKSALENLKIVGKFETGTYWIRQPKLKNKWKEKGLLEELKQENNPIENKSENHKVELTEKKPDPNKLTLAENAIWSVLANFMEHTVSSIINELKESGNYKEDDIKKALRDMETRGEIIVSEVV